MIYTIFKTFIVGWLMVCEETEISALGFFYVSKSSMLAAFSTILGYLIILVQFSQSDTPSYLDIVSGNLTKTKN